MSQRDYYEVLGVDKGADTKQIKKAYKRLAMKHHPDRNTDNKKRRRKNLRKFKKHTPFYLTSKNVKPMTNLAMQVLMVVLAVALAAEIHLVAAVLAIFLAIFLAVVDSSKLTTVALIYAMT